MRKLAAIIALCTVSFFSNGQAITLNASDMPLPDTFNMQDLSAFASPPPPVVSAGGIWDYSSYSCSAYFTDTYQTETDTFFTGAGITINHPTFKTFGSPFGSPLTYNIVSELKANATVVAESGIKIPAQAFDISGCTATPTDSLFFPAQSAIYTTQMEVLHFPITMGSSWSSVSRRTNNFLLTIVADSLNRAPGQHVYTVHKTDTIVGWGTARVHATSGPSILYPVLIDRVTEYSEDSIYVNGAPAMDTVLSLFGVVQGARTGMANIYNFLRSGSFNYLLSFYYGSDSTFSHCTDVSLDTDNLELSTTGVTDMFQPAAGTILYPNPLIGKDIHVISSGLTIAAVYYTITDLAGKVIEKGLIAGQGTNVNIHLQANLIGGTYQLTLFNKDGGRIFAEEIVVR